ncbi:hypothetical protein, partial [Pseudomonas savastanoi]
QAATPMHERQAGIAVIEVAAGDTTVTPSKWNFFLPSCHSVVLQFSMRWWVSTEQVHMALILVDTESEPARATPATRALVGFAVF